MATVYMVIGSHGWGRGATLKEAKKNWSANAMRSVRRPEPTVYVVDIDDETKVYMDEIGYVFGLADARHVSGPDPLNKPEAQPSA